MAVKDGKSGANISYRAREKPDMEKYIRHRGLLGLRQRITNDASGRRRVQRHSEKTHGWAMGTPTKSQMSATTSLTTSPSNRPMPQVASNGATRQEQRRSRSAHEGRFPSGLASLPPFAFRLRDWRVGPKLDHLACAFSRQQRSLSLCCSDGPATRRTHDSIGPT
jgi:hypothetical protein